ncbi:MAG TPA: T9SS type A sorting domain-containing protein, partial [Chryseolinea sp.]
HEETDFVRLSWATASELNFDKFLIERSLDGKVFSEIGTQKGAGTSVSKRDYYFEDRSPIVGRSYYRLKAVDYDGFTENFGVESCNYVGPKSIVIYPNPSQGETVKLMMNFHPDEQSRIEIFNSIGVKLDQFLVSEFAYDISLPAGLKAGSYLLRYTSASYSQVVRFSVL